MTRIQRARRVRRHHRRRWVLNSIKLDRMMRAAFPDTCFHLVVPR